MSEYFDATDIALAVEENEGAMRQAPTYEFSEKQAELDFMQNARYLTDGQKWAKHTILSLRQQLAAAHAENLRLRGALQMIEHATAPTHDDDAFHENAYTLAKEALAAPPGDMAALREVCARVIVEAKDNYVNVRNAADDLRSGEWTPEVMK